MKKTKSKLRQYIESFVIAVLVVLSVKSLVFANYAIPSASMEPTLLIGDYLIANRLSYVVKIPLTDIVVLTLGEPQRGDIIIFRYPGDRSIDYVKRVIAKGGDTVEIRDKRLRVNGQSDEIAAARYIDKRVMPGALSPRDNFGPVTVPKDSYFVMGDNRDNSNDSRYWGTVPEANLVGRAFFIWMNWDWQNKGIAFDRIGTILK